MESSPEKKTPPSPEPKPSPEPLPEREKVVCSCANGKIEKDGIAITCPRCNGDGFLYKDELK